MYAKKKDSARIVALATVRNSKLKCADTHVRVVRTQADKSRSNSMLNLLLAKLEAKAAEPTVEVRTVSTGSKYTSKVRI